jgi:hypothetical protein
MIKLPEKELIIIITVLSIKANGWMISNMDMVLKLGLMVADMKAITIWEKKAAKASIFGKMAAIMKEIGLTTRF